MDSWNHHFFLRRHVFLRLFKVHKKSKERDSDEETDSDSSISSYDSDRKSRRARNYVKRPRFTYRLSAASIPLDPDTSSTKGPYPPVTTTQGPLARPDYGSWYPPEPPPMPFQNPFQPSPYGYNPSGGPNMAEAIPYAERPSSIYAPYGTSYPGLS